MRTSLVLVLAVLVALLGGCVADAGEPGQMALSLKTTSPTSGATYRLRHGDVTITGGGRTVVLHTEDDLDASILVASLPAGQYALSLASGWSLERLAVDGSAETVQATLASPLPIAFTVTSGGFRLVSIAFHTTGVVIEPNRGEIGVRIVVDDTPRETIGFPTYGGATEAMAPFKAYAQRFTLTHQVHVRSLGIIGIAPPGVQMAIYFDDNGKPSNRTHLTPTSASNPIPNPTDIAIPDQTMGPGSFWLAVTGVSYLGRVAGAQEMRCEGNLVDGGLPTVGGQWRCQPGTALNLFATGVP